MRDVEKPRDTSELGKEITEGGIIELVMGLGRLAEVMEIEDQQRYRGSGMNLSDGRISLAPREANIFWRRAVLEAINRGLQELNKRFPGERLKAKPEQDSTFRNRRYPLLTLQKRLVREQREERGIISKALGSRQEDKQLSPSPF